MRAVRTRFTDVTLDLALKALASAQRREIVRALSAQEPERGKSCCAEDELCACKLSERLGLAPSTISYHMTALREAGLVSVRRDGTWAYYRLDRDALEAVATALREL